MKREEFEPRIDTDGHKWNYVTILYIFCIPSVHVRASPWLKLSNPPLHAWRLCGSLKYPVQPGLAEAEGVASAAVDNVQGPVAV
jgi:hypothetical protein